MTKNKLRTAGCQPSQDIVIIFSTTFDLDPTHLRPIPSETLRFFVEASGFCNLEVRPLHPYPHTMRLPETKGGIAERFNDLLRRSN